MRDWEERKKGRQDWLYICAWKYKEAQRTVSTLFLLHFCLWFSLQFFHLSFTCQEKIKIK